ncbi:MAG: hypothetical protein S4CHLAM7_01040 [Chlamydiae bacterium]|nr:hypothetical protein [Chlamydiota bacterium]
MDLNKYELQFPCDYPIKVIGYASEHFKKNVLSIVYQHFKQKISDDLISYKMSKNNKYLSITVNFTAQNRIQVEQIYKDLRRCKEVVHLL